MKIQHLFSVIILLLGTWTSVSATPSSQVSWTPETFNLLKNANPEKGKTLSAGCASCHGAEGVSPAATFPHLAGQRADYTYKQLRDYKDKTRTHAMMNALVAGLSDQDMADLSVFYADLPLPEGKSSDETIDVSESVITKGDGKRLIPSCASCHDSRGSLKNYGVPVLDGQMETYLNQTTQAYKTGARANDVYKVMRLIAQQLTDEEIAMSAAYYAGRGNE
jgi:cytochrome c553